MVLEMCLVATNTTCTITNKNTYTTCVCPCISLLLIKLHTLLSFLSRYDTSWWAFMIGDCNLLRLSLYLVKLSRIFTNYYSLFSEWTHTPLELQFSIHRSTIFNTEWETVWFEYHNYLGRWALCGHLRPSIEGLLLALRNGTSCAVSDGSFYPNEKVGAAAWIIITPDGTEWIEGDGQQTFRTRIAVN